MNDELITLADKSYIRRLVAQTNEYPSFYKYCDFDGGLKMLSAMNMQFTRADGLNDKDEVNLSKCDLDTVTNLLVEVGISKDTISRNFARTQAYFSGIGICSCGKSAHNERLWKDYASKDGVENGMCIELDQSAVINHLISKNIKIMALIVHYFTNVTKVLPWDLFLGNDFEKHIFLQLLYTSKLKSRWAEEDEVRFIYSEPFEGKYFRPSISPKCIKAVYYGNDMSRYQRMKIGQILNRYKNIKRFTNH